MSNTRIKKNSWFIEGKQHNRQVGLYKLFVDKKGIPVERLIELIYQFKQEILIPSFTSNRQRNSLKYNERSKLLSYVSENFGQFITLVQRETGIKFNINSYKKKAEDKADAEFAEQQLDFMMNGGSTDDL